MIKKYHCVRCGRELGALGFYTDAVAYEDELLAEGIEVDNGNDLCDECVQELQERGQVRG